VPRAATQDKPQPAKGEITTFYSRHGKLRLVRVPQQVVPDGWGSQVTRERFPGVTRVVYEFDRGQLEVEVGGKNWHVLPDGPDGEEQSTIDWLRNHSEFNQRFHESGNEPGRPLPSDEDFMGMVNAASMALDVDKITELLKNERETHNRPALVTIADRARKQALQMRQELEAQTPPEAA
jgi:hypothetical protein